MIEWVPHAVGFFGVCLPAVPDQVHLRGSGRGPDLIDLGADLLRIGGGVDPGEAEIDGIGPVAIGDEPADYLVEIGRGTDPAVHEQHRVAGIGTPWSG